MGRMNHHEKSGWSKARPNLLILLFALICFSIHRDRKSYFHLKDRAGRDNEWILDCDSWFLSKLRRLLPFCGLFQIHATNMLQEHFQVIASLCSLPSVSLIPPFHPFGPPKCQEVG